MVTNPPPDRQQILKLAQRLQELADSAAARAAELRQMAGLAQARDNNGTGEES